MYSDHILAAQKPVGSGYDRKTDASQVLEGVDLSGKTAVVTGGYSGVGLGVSRALARVGARVILPARDTDKARKAQGDIGGDTLVCQMDLTNFAQVDGFAQDVAALTDRVHILVNNAGVHKPPQRYVRETETTLRTNVAGHMVLTRKLLDPLKRAGGANVVNVGSCAHKLFEPAHLDDLNFVNREWKPHRAYALAAACKNLLTRFQQMRWGGEGVRFNSVHPGYVPGTGIMRCFTEQDRQDIGQCDENGEVRPELKAIEKTFGQGAAPVVFAALDERVRGGTYVDDHCDVASLVTDGTPEFEGVLAETLDPENANTAAVAVQRLMKPKIDLFF